MSKLIPKRMFFTKGVGYHKTKLQSFELALRSCGIETCNIVYVSSIFPPDCVVIPKKEGLKALAHGQITFSVMAQISTNEPDRLMAAAIGLAQPRDKRQYGYISEHHAFGETSKFASDFAEDLAATMLASTLGVEMDPEKAWNERKQLYVTEENHMFKSRSFAQSARGHKDGLWTTAITCAILLLE